MKKLIIAIIFVLIAPLNIMATCRYGVINPYGDGGGNYGYASWAPNLQSGNYTFSDWTYQKYNKKKVIAKVYERDNNNQITEIYNSGYVVVLELNGYTRTSGCNDKTCEIEETQANQDCSEGWEWTNEENCEWACNTCTDEKAALEAECGDLGYQIDDETCLGHCNPVPDCNDEYLEKLAECGDAGIKEWNNEQCVGSCNAKKDCAETDPCIDYSDNCYNQKCDLYGVESMDCQSSEDDEGCWTVTSQECNCNDNSSNCSEYRQIAENSCGGSNQIESYYCNEEDFDNRFFHCAEPPPDPNNPTPDDTDPGESPNDPGGSNPPGDPDDPNNQPAPDPVDDPEATEDQKQNTRLDALKANSDTLIDQNNVQIGQLGDIVKDSNITARNSKIIADNQGILQDELRIISKTNKSGFKDLKEAIEGIDLPDEINVEHDLDFSELATDEQIPTLTGNEFDSSLPDDNNYNEYDNLTERGTEAGNTYLSNHYSEDEIQVTAEITAVGEPCIAGNVTIHNQSVPIAICFNKPWMLQGYSIMKYVMIAMAYLQTAILLNKALRS